MACSLHSRSIMQKCLIVSVVLVSACSAGAGAEGELTDHRPAGASVYDGRVRQLQFEDRDLGTHPAIPRDAVCSPYVSSYTVRVAEHELAWQYCDRAADPDDGRAYTPHVGRRALPGSEWSAFEPTLAALTISAGGPGYDADVGIVRLTVSTDDGDREYGDDIITCSPGKCIGHEALGDAMQAARALAGK